MTTYEARPSITEKASIRNKCINYVYDCNGECNTKVVYDYHAEDRQDKRQELDKCMTHYQENLRSKFSNSSEYKTPLNKEQADGNK